MANSKTAYWIILLGVLLLIGGFVAYLYEERIAIWEGFTVTVYVLGVVLIIAGVVLKTRASF